jgi:hypothetical protein
VAQPELRAALEALSLAERAKSPAKRVRALAAISAARDGLRRLHRMADRGSGRRFVAGTSKGGLVGVEVLTCSRPSPRSGWRTARRAEVRP